MRVKPLAAPALAVALACATSPAPEREPPAARAPHAAEEARAAAEKAVAAAEEALRRNDLTRADALAAEAERLGAPGPRAAAIRAEVAIRQGRVADTLELARASLARGESVEARMLEGRALARKRDLEGAAGAFQRAAVADPSGEAWSAVVGARLALGDEDAAAAAWAALVRLVRPLEAEDLVWHDILRMQPDPRQIEEALDRSARGTAARIAGKHAEARHELGSVVATVGSFAHAWAELGKAHVGLGAPAEAEQDFRTALARYRPDQAALRADTQAQLAALLVRSGGDAREAVALARDALPVRGERPAILAVLAEACEKAGDAVCAREAWGRLAAIPGIPEALRERADERVERLGR